jgi:hypothetical protein
MPSVAGTAGAFAAVWAVPVEGNVVLAKTNAIKTGMEQEFMVLPGVGSNEPVATPGRRRNSTRSHSATTGGGRINPDLGESVHWAEAGHLAAFLARFFFGSSSAPPPGAG